MRVNFDKITNFFLGSAIDKLSKNFEKTGQEFDKVVYRDGSAEMQGDLDMNSRRLLNLAYPKNENDAITLKAAREVAQGISKGPPGPADNTYTTMAELLASDKTRKVARYTPDAGEPGAPGTFNVIEGEWVRQEVDGINFRGPTGSIRSLQEKLSDFAYFPEDFGAKGDGITDDTDSIKAAVSAASALASSNRMGLVKLAQGKTYKCTSNITIPVDKVQFDGSGATLDFSTLATNGANAIYLTGDIYPPWYQPRVFGNVHIKGPGGYTGATTYTSVGPNPNPKPYSTANPTPDRNPNPKPKSKPNP